MTVKNLMLNVIHLIEWLHEKELMTHKNIQNLFTDVTIHILHILQQYAKGYITGTSTNRWKNYALTHSRLNISSFPFIQILIIQYQTYVFVKSYRYDTFYSLFAHIYSY